MKFHLLHPRKQLVQIMQRIYRYGLTTTSAATCPFWMKTAICGLPLRPSTKATSSRAILCASSRIKASSARTNPPASTPSTS